MLIYCAMAGCQFRSGVAHCGVICCKARDSHFSTPSSRVNVAHDQYRTGDYGNSIYSYSKISRITAAMSNHTENHEQEAIHKALHLEQVRVSTRFRPFGFVYYVLYGLILWPLAYGHWDCSILLP